MEINVKLDRNFTTEYNRLQKEYGSEIARLNGFDNRQLSYTDFIDNFIDIDTVADSSIDGNSNVSHKDIVTLEREMPKPHEKLLAFNKIFYEINKKFGLKAANDWLKAEWLGKLYMHDANSSTFRSYCFTGDTKILTNYGIKRLDELVDVPIMVLNKNHGWESATVKYFGKQPVKLLTLERYDVTKTIAVTGNHKWFCKNKKSDKNLIVVSTDELKVGMKIPFNTSGVWSRVDPSPFGVAHGFFTGDGYKSPDKPKANFCGEKTALIPYFTPANIVGNEKEYGMCLCPRYFNNLPSLSEAPSYLYGWLSGYFAADGCVDTRGRCTIASTNIEYLNFARDVLCILGMPVNEIRYQDRISNLTHEESRIYTLTLSEEYLKDDFFILPKHRERILANRKSDRKDRWWRVVSVEETNSVEDVYCAVVPNTESFTLDNNILTHNCFAYDLKDLAEKGLYFIEGQNACQAKHLTTFVDFVKEFVSFACNRTSGAVGLPNIIPYMFYFWHKDVESDYLGIKTSHNEKYYARQNFQRFIYAVNQPYVRDGSQSAFTNTSVFDRPYFEALFGGAVFPDGTFMIDYEEEIIEFQKWYMEVMSEIRSVNMFTFPVSTISLLRQNGKFVDEEFARWAVRHNMIWSDSNLFVDDTVNSLSNCPLSPDTEILYRFDSDGSQYCTDSIKDVYYELKKQNEDIIKVLSNGKEIDCRINRFNIPIEYKITLSNGATLKTTANHLNKVYGKSYVETKDLTDDDYLPFSSDVYSESYNWVKIKSIKSIKGANESYCLEVMNDDVEPVFTLANGIETHNCRLKSNIEDLGYFNSIGGTALKVGSVKVSTINLARLALDTNSEEEYLSELENRVWINLQALDCVRHIINRNVEKGLLPNFTYGLIDFDHLYNTIGFIGCYETMKRFGYTRMDEFGNTFYTEKASRFGEKIFKTMRKVADKFIEKYNCDYMINTEQIPAESAAAKLMLKDKIFYPNANIYDLPLYGNQFIPLGIQTTGQERVRIASEFDSYCNGGSILHYNIDAPFDSFEKAWKMTNYIADKGVTYFAFNTKISACKHNHAFYGKTCPVCGEPVDTEYTRIVGFYTPVKTYSAERKSEYKMRKWQSVNN